MENNEKENMIIITKDQAYEFATRIMLFQEDQIINFIIKRENPLNFLFKSIYFLNTILSFVF